MALNVLISGGGIAGPALAYWLARQGHNVTIVERSLRLRAGGQGVDFRGPSIDVLDKMGVLEQVREKATGMGAMILVDADGRETARMPPEVISGELEILWGDLARILHDAVRDDVEYRFGDHITGLRDDGSQVSVTFDKSGEATFDLVIGADGVHSGVRALAFGPERQFVTEFDRYFTFFAMENHLGLDHCTVGYMGSTRTVGLQAIEPDAPARAMLYLTEPGLKYDYRDTAGNKQLFADRFADLGWETPRILQALAATDEVYFDSLCQVHLDSYATGRVCLIGDAAWCASPRSGMGTSLAIVGSYVLAHELAAAKGDFEAAFARFHELMTPYVKRCQQLALDNLKRTSADTPLSRLVRKVGFLALRLPGVSQLVARQALAVGRSFTLPTYA